MKRIFRIFVIETVSLFIASRIASGLIFTNPITGLVITGIALAIASYLVKPIVNLLLLPLTLATLGIFKFINNAIMLFVVDLAINQFAVTEFNFAGLHTPYFEIPSVNLPAGPLAYIAFSLIISVISSVSHWIAR